MKANGMKLQMNIKTAFIWIVLLIWQLMPLLGPIPGVIILKITT
jgi:hypothetical protein